jgi:prepilin-type N-terminal cleavage/methylation domain-containing protein
MHSKRLMVDRREAFTLIELIVVVAIILAIAALAAAFAPSFNDSTNLSRAIDTVEQTLLTAKVRAKRDQLATGVRFIQASGDAPNTYSQMQFIQQPDPLAGGTLVFVPTGGAQPPGSVAYQTVTNNNPGTIYLTNGILLSAVPNASGSIVSFGNVDFGLGGVTNPQEWVVQPGDFLELRDGGVSYINTVTSSTSGGPVNQIYIGITGALTTYDTSLSITTPTTNYRILRQPRLLVGEPPVALPNNFAFDMGLTTTLGANAVQNGPSGLGPEILFSPTGAVVGTNAGSGKLYMVVHDVIATPVDLDRAGIVAVQCRTGFIGAYGVATVGSDPFYFAEVGRESGL